MTIAIFQALVNLIKILKDWYPHIFLSNFLVI